MKQAYFNQRYKYIEYWTADDDCTLISCNTIFIARKIISMSGIMQELKVM